MASVYTCQAAQYSFLQSFIPSTMSATFEYAFYNFHSDKRKLRSTSILSNVMRSGICNAFLFINFEIYFSFSDVRHYYKIPNG